MHVLEHALQHVRRLQAEVLAHLRVERLRQVAQRQAARQHLPLQLEPQDDVQAVRDLVRVDPPQRRLHLVERAVERLERDLRERFGQRLLELRVEEPPRREAAADQVLPHPALRLVERRGGAVCERRALVGRVDLPLVEAVAELVQAGEEPVEGVLVEVGRQADVRRRERDLEGMDGAVEPPRRAVHSPPLEHGEREGALFVAREAAAQAGVVHGRGVGDGPHHRHQRRLEPLEDPHHLARLHPRLVVVQEDVVGVARRREAGDVLAAELELALEVR